MPSPTDDAAERQLLDLAKDFEASSQRLFGYQLDVAGVLSEHSLPQADTRAMEREVLDFFAGMFGLKSKEYTGRITNGDTDDILYALHNARARYPRAIVYYSAASNRNVAAGARLLRMHSREVACKESGEIDYHDFGVHMRQARGNPVTVIANLGTALTEARDDIAKLCQIIEESGVYHHYIHVDAALAGNYADFIAPRPSFDFTTGTDSITLSGHTFIGTSIPCGVALSHSTKPSTSTDNTDMAMSSPHTGHTAVLMWHAVRRLGLDGLQKQYAACEELAAYALQSLEDAGVKAWRNPGALTVVFKAPPAKFRHIWQLPSEDGWSHIICMPGITRARVDDFVNKLSAL